MRPSAAGAALLAGLLVAGCGGGGRLSKQDYARQADAICSKYNRKIEALGKPKSSALAEVARFADQALALERKGNAELEGLKPPKSQEKTAREWVAQNDVVEKAVGDLRDAARKNDRAALGAALRRGNSANQVANKLARQLGLSVCPRG